MHLITAQQLRRAAPHCKSPDAWVEPLNNAMLIYGISDDVDYMVEFLAQCAHETASFNRLEENLNYSAQRMAEVWPTRFAVDPRATEKEPNALARQLAGKPHALADAVYGGRMGNTEPGDGWRFRGRGMPMVTGRANYLLVSQRLNDKTVMLVPDKLCTRVTAAMAGAAWWTENPKLNQLADDLPGDDDHADFVSITKIVNGGKEGLNDRARFRAAFKAALL